MFVLVAQVFFTRRL